MKFKDAINRIKEEVSIVDVISGYVSIKKSGSNYVGLCPFHNEDTPSFFVNESKKVFKCFGCNKGGNIFSFLQDYLNITFKEAVSMLAKKVGISIDYKSNNDNNKEVNVKYQKLYELYNDVAWEYNKTLYMKNGEVGYKYLKGRNINDDSIKKFIIGYAPNDYGYMYNIMKSKGYDNELLIESNLFRLYNGKYLDNFYNRIMLPLVDEHNHVIGFQSRSIDSKSTDRKYINSKDSDFFHKSKFIYGLNFAQNTKYDYYIFCEGNIDVITLHQSGYDNAVAVMGTALNKEQVMLLRNKFKKVYLCQDNDEAGFKAIISAYKIFKNYGIETYVIDLRPYKDVDEFINNCGVEEFNNRVKTVKSPILYAANNIKQKFNFGDTNDLEKYTSEIVELFCN